MCSEVLFSEKGLHALDTTLLHPKEKYYAKEMQFLPNETKQAELRTYHHMRSGCFSSGGTCAHVCLCMYVCSFVCMSMCVCVWPHMHVDSPQETLSHACQYIPFMFKQCFLMYVLNKWKENMYSILNLASFI